MAGRTGLQTAVKLCNRFCKFLSTWKPSVVGAINASTLTTEQKNLAIATLDAIESSCDVFRMLMTTWES